MGTQRKYSVLFVFLLVLVPALVGVLSGASAESLAAPLLDPPPTFTITPSAGANGAISPASPQTVDFGAGQAFTIIPDIGYHVADVEVDGSSVGAVTGYTFANVDADHTISATFAVNTFTITPTAGANGAISPATVQTVNYGGARAFTITPAAGYHVADVEVDGVSVGARTSYTFTSVTADHTIDATFAVDTFTITPSAGANGAISPSTVQTIASGGSRTFTIDPDPGYHVANVLVDGSSVGAVTSYAFTNVDADHTISATFAVDTFTLTPSAGANGAISPSTVQTVNSGGSRAFTITPAAGHHVADVLVDGSSVGAPTSHTFTNVSADHTISATFAVDTFTITPTAGLNGSISPATPQAVQYGGSQTFTITPDTGYHVANVLVDGSSVGAQTSHTFTNVSADHTISATFAIDTFTLTPTAGPDGAISPGAPQTVGYGDDPVFTITPDTGYHVADVLVDGVSVGAPTSYTFTNVTADHTISATFAIDTFTITPSAGAHGAISPSTPQTVNFGGSLTFTITADSDYYVADVLVDGASEGPITSRTFINVTADHTIGASFAPGVQTGLDMTFGKTVVNYGGSTLLGGRLYDATSGAGLGGRTVTLERSTSVTDPSWTTVDTFFTSSDPGTLGRFTTTVSAKSPTWYRLRYVAAPQSEYGSRTGDQRKLGMRPALGRPVPPRSARARRWFTVYGSLKPHFTAGQKTVKVNVYRYRNGRWVPVKALYATNVDNGDVTRYRLRVRFTTKGKYRFVATSTPAGWAKATTSPSRTTVVR